MKIKFQVLLLLLLCVVLGSALYSCKRTELIENSYTRLVRKWLLIRSATDNNGNGSIDAYEYNNVQDSVVNYYTFKGDSSGEESVKAINGVTTLYPFRWSLSGDSLQITRVGNNVNTYYIRNLSNSRLELYLGTDRGPVGYYFEPR